MARTTTHSMMGLCLGALSLGAGCASMPTARDRTGFRQPAEFEPQTAVWLSAEPDNPEFMRITASMITELLPHVSVKVLLTDDAILAATKESLRQNGVGVDAVEFFVNPLATLFMRDGAVYLVNGCGDLAVLDLKWSTYGLPGWCRRLYPDDPKRIAECESYSSAQQDALDRSLANMSSAAIVSSQLFLENATFEVNGKGVLLISEPLALERNPGRGRDSIESDLRAIPGVRKVIWLSEGVAQDPLEASTIEGSYVGKGAGGHTDEFVRFADPSTILLAWVEDERITEHPLNQINRTRMQSNWDILAAATDQDGKPFRIIKVPMPAVIERKAVLAPKSDQTEEWNEVFFPEREGRKAGDTVIQVAASSYLNFVVANDLVLVPSYIEDGTPAAVQEQVRSAFELAFRGRQIRFIHATPFNWNGGGPHCATLSQPASCHR